MLSSYKLSLFAIAAALSIETAFYCWIPFGIRGLIDVAVPTYDREVFALIVRTFVGGALLASSVGFARDYVYANLQSSALSRLRQRMFECLQQLSMSFHVRAALGDVFGAFAKDLAAIEAVAGIAAPRTLLPAIHCITCTCVLAVLDWRLAASASLLWPWLLLAPRRLDLQALKARGRQKADEEIVLDAVWENLSAQTIVRALSLERIGVSVFRKRNDLLARSTMQAGLLTMMRERLAMSGILLIHVAQFALGMTLVTSGAITLGTMVAAQILAVMLAVTLFTMSNSASDVKEARNALQRINAFLQEPVGSADSHSAKVMPPFSGELRFRGVDFSYNGHDPALDGAYARIKKGSYVAFVGGSGSGKSTMLNLLMRFYDPLAGSITIDGHDIRGFTVNSLRSQLGVVLEDNFLFSTSIKENIRLGRPSATDPEVYDAAQRAGIHDFIMTLPQGYESLGGERGEPFSHGNRQRIALARAILRHPAILLLDEATSALDASTEADLLKTIRAVTADTTVIAVTHRLSAAQFADHIFVFDQGKVTEQGSHNELLAAEGLYANLWRKQAGFTFSADGGHVDVDAQRLRALPILEHIDETRLAELAPFFTTDNYPAGREIVRQGDPGDKFYIIVRGKVEVLRSDGLQEPVRRVAILHDGDYFGEITLLTGFPRTATVRTLTLCTCISLERVQFNRMLDRFPELQQEISGVARDRLKLASAASA